MFTRLVTGFELQLTATFIEQFFTVNCLQKRQNKEKRVREWSIFKKKENYYDSFPPTLFLKK